MDNKARLEAWKLSQKGGRPAPRGSEPADGGSSAASSRDQASEEDVSDLLETSGGDSTSTPDDAARKARIRRERKEELRQQEEERRREIEALLPSDADVSARLDELNRRERRRQIGRLRNIALFGLLPVLLALAYITLIKEHYFQTEASFAITTVNSSPQSPAMNLMGLGGGGAGMTDGYRVREYLRSREVMQIMEQEHGYLSHFDSGPAAGSLDYGFYQDRVSILVDQQEGLLTLNVDGATPEDAVRYANILLELARSKVRNISQSIDDDQLEDLVEVEQQAQDELTQAQGRVQEIQTRQAELDPRLSAQGIYGIINNLEVELAEAEARRQALLSNGLSESPFLPRLDARIQALQRQIAEQQGRLTSSQENGSLGRSLALFEAAVAERDAAATTLAAARETLQQARLRGLEQRKYLVLIASPIQPLEREESRLLDLLLLLLGAIVIILIAGFIMLKRPMQDSE
ncbi:hypothetical protein [Aurantiacibacter hainanensis]|uniref:hypothetical protein n=1 Tax=Aurantiacibacter hainanensis TaxID=3076114 RepID=UPI0030C75DC3